MGRKPVGLNQDPQISDSCFETLGVRLIVCIDNILILAESKELVLQAMDALIYVLAFISQNRLINASMYIIIIVACWIHTQPCT